MKKSRSKSESKRSSRPKKKVNGLSKTNTVTKTINAPSAVYTRPLISMAFSGNEKSARIRCTIPLCQLSTSSGSEQANGIGTGAMRCLVRTTTGSSTFANAVFSNLLFSPVRPAAMRLDTSGNARMGDASFFNAFIENYAVCFARHRLNSLIFYYCPQQNTSQASGGHRFAMTWSADPCHAQIGFGAYAGTTGAVPQTESTAMSMTNVVPFSPFMPVTLRADLAHRDWVDNYLGSFGGITSTIASPSFGSIRSSCYGVLCVLADSTATLEVQGYIYASMDIEFAEPNPLVTVIPSLPLRMFGQPNSASSFTESKTSTSSTSAIVVADRISPASDDDNDFSTLEKLVPVRAPVATRVVTTTTTPRKG